MIFDFSSYQVGHSLEYSSLDLTLRLPKVSVSRAYPAIESATILLVRGQLGPDFEEKGAPDLMIHPTFTLFLVSMAFIDFCLARVFLSFIVDLLMIVLYLRSFGFPSRIFL